MTWIPIFVPIGFFIAVFVVVAGAYYSLRRTKPEITPNDYLNLILSYRGPLGAVIEGSSKRSGISKQRKQQPVESTAPPQLAEYLLYFFLSKRDRVNLIGDLEEEYTIVQTKFGRRSATLWYYKQALTSIGPQARKWVVKWGAVAWVEEWVRRHL